ncbi:transglutaminase family protein [Rarobacter faecitabidus]|uniref:Transglutaminase-like putative cysteine protease n=1 Tax=Rarobacter faecitabidus TaxID=13243 RepID=A0A542ZUX2_RARFA|nr:transglutaminase family protein [Rarobacter faecitabidus]TQL64163.1 transglutaminase-like putative cysteine protease [Rarobacter faecitabidus]
MSRYEVVHTNAFRYQAPVRASYNEARMTPSQGRGQRLIDFELDIDPATSRYEYTDYWGTRVTSFEVLRPHSQLSIVGRSVVETAVIDIAQRSDATWGDLRDEAQRDRMSGYLMTSAATEVPGEVCEVARSYADVEEPDSAAVSISLALRDEMEYVPGVTTAHTLATEAWHVRKGVCQDIAQLTVGALRSVGIPALYVSGYYDPRDGADLDGATVIGQSHAWVEWWAGSWRAFDPTNRAPVGDRYIVIGRGREYADVPPFKGVYTGGGTSALDVSVAMTRRN